MCGIHLHLSRLVQLHNDDEENGDNNHHHHYHQDHDEGDGKNDSGGSNSNSNNITSSLSSSQHGGGGNDANDYYPAWLCRRGPDHQGCFHTQLEQKVCLRTTNHDATRPTGSTVVDVAVKLSLQASVLSMRERLVQQPVVIWQQQRRRRQATKLSTRVAGAVCNTEAAAHRNNREHDNAIIHLCWNGEVYQEQQLQQQQEVADGTENDEKNEMLEQQQQQQHHDVWRFHASDTNLVAQRLQEALDDLLLSSEKNQVQHESPPDDDIMNQEEEEDSSSQQQQQQQEQDDDVFHAIHKTMSSLINAEFAYCITTSSCIYYGKDPWGCRSLLTGIMMDNDATSSSSLTSTLIIKEEEEEADSRCYCWYLSSVGIATETTASTAAATMCHNCKNSSNTRPRTIEWTEVPPGIVFEYNFMTDQTRSLPLVRQTLSVGKEMRTTTTMTSTSLNHAAAPNNNNKNGVDESHDDKSNDKSNGEGTRRHDNDDAIPQDDDRDELAPSRQLYALLRQAVRRRLTGPCTILFSGGLDSVVLAALALQRQQELQQEEQAAQEQQQDGCCCDYSIALVNISFLDDDETGNSSSPPVVAADTRAALASYQELQRLYPNANFEFIQRQVTYQQVAEQEEHIRKLIWPKQSTMDLNIATALWFAAQSTSSSSSEHRILLTGLGADELMGGYGRHRKAYERGGASALRDELRMDQERLWERNLGRDDRVLSDHGKEARFPYLDCDVVQFLISLASSSSSCSSLCDYSLPPGQGDKRILRLVASHFLHLDVASTAVKRAIQFGSRISHVCDKRRFGSRRRQREKHQP